MQPQSEPASSGFSTSYQGTLLGMPSTHGPGMSLRRMARGPD